MAKENAKEQAKEKAKDETKDKAKDKAKDKTKDKTKDKGVSAPVGPGYIPRLKKIYADKVALELKDEFGYTSSMQVPKFIKVVVSMGVGEAKENKKILDAAVGDVGIITGQKAVKTKARTSIAVFKIREGQEIGCRVTLRGTQMWEFLDRLMNVALPRVKDFRGVNANAFDGHGNYSMGLTEQIIFPEIDYDKIEKVMGMNVAIVTTARTDKEAKSLLAKMGMPFRK